MHHDAIADHVKNDIEGMEYDENDGVCVPKPPHSAFAHCFEYLGGVTSGSTHSFLCLTLLSDI